MSSGEQTRYHTAEERKTGITMMNTRIIESFNKNIDRPVLEVFNSYYEFNRLGSYHGYWTIDQAKIIIAYLQNWIGRVKDSDKHISADKFVFSSKGDIMLQEEAERTKSRDDKDG